MITRAINRLYCFNLPLKSLFSVFMRVIAFDTVPSTVEMMRRGLVRAVVSQQPFLQGYQAVRAAFDVLLTGASKQGEQIIMENQIRILENL